MTERVVLVRNRLGIHVRPAQSIAQTASAFRSRVSLQNGDCKVNAKSMLGMLALEGGFGAEITIRADGPDEREAVEALAKLFDDGFGEELG
jgi:phosphocarrier protein